MRAMMVTKGRCTLWAWGLWGASPESRKTEHVLTENKLDIVHEENPRTNLFSCHYQKIRWSLLQIGNAVFYIGLQL